MLLDYLRELNELLKSKNIDHALIGGLALGAHGVQRFTNDIDFVIDEQDVDTLIELLEVEGYTVFHRSADILQFAGKVPVDILIARRPVSRKFLKEAKPLAPYAVKCISIEGLIALKIQAYKNNPKRELGDKADIQALIQSNKVNWKKLKPIIEKFGEWKEIQRIRRLADD